MSSRGMSGGEGFLLDPRRAGPGAPHASRGDRRSEPRLSRHDQLERKAQTLAGSIRTGRGALALVRAMLADAIGQPCPYCRRPLGLDTVALDHAEPLKSRGARRSALLRRQYFDRPENLVLVCRECNALKADLRPEEFRALLSFMWSHPTVGANLRRRLGHERKWWGGVKRRG